jgi:hypothetical protein
MTYKPSRQNTKILKIAFDHIKSVLYKVSLRWVFYRLLQEGYYTSKNDYNKWKSLASVARKRFHLSWHPNLLADDTRSIISRNFGYHNEQVLRAEYFDDLIENNPVGLDHFVEQEEVVIICFEARAMADQFRHYTERIHLIPFGGDPSIPLKWKIAQRIELYYHHYKKNIRVLYFGDYDSKGLQIVDSAMHDIKQWCDYPFDITPCGLTLQQALDYDIPENPEKPGKYQWEALNDLGAGEIIETALSVYIDNDILNSIKNREEQLTKEFQKKLKDLIL